MKLLTAIVPQRTAMHRSGMDGDPRGNLSDDRLSDGPEVLVPLLDRIRAFFASPQGRRFTDRGRRYASDPRNQQRARDALDRWRRRR